jgi:DNA-binding MarR family transcriptional regulator
MGRIADMYEVRHTGATGIVERIERHGLLERRHRADDRRVVECRLTRAGEELLDELAGLSRASLERALSVLTADELRELDRLLRLVTHRSQALE